VVGGNDKNFEKLKASKMIKINAKENYQEEEHRINKLNQAPLIKSLVNIKPNAKQAN
jgi:hypothetical protein